MCTIDPHAIDRYRSRFAPHLSRKQAKRALRRIVRRIRRRRDGALVLYDEQAGAITLVIRQNRVRTIWRDI